RLTYGDSIVVASNPDDGSEKVIREDNAVPERGAKGGSGPAQILALAVSPDGKYLAIGSVDQIARVFEIATGQERGRLLHEKAVRTVTFSADARYLATGSDDQTAKVLDLVSGKEAARLTHNGPVTAVAFSPDARYLATGSQDNGNNVVRVFDVAGQKESWHVMN